tara:strand:- start:504 stop:1346 length:843 start_codon:yes stop_codon:yes gene_type:complete
MVEFSPLGLLQGVYGVQNQGYGSTPYTFNQTPQYTIRPAIPVSGPNVVPNVQQIPRTIGTVTNPGMVGRNVDVGAGSGMQPVLEDNEALEKWGKSKRVVAKDAPEGIGRNILGLLDFVTLGIADFDKRGNLFGGEHLPGLRPGSGYGGQVEYEPVEKPTVKLPQGPDAGIPTGSALPTEAEMDSWSRARERDYWRTRASTRDRNRMMLQDASNKLGVLGPQLLGLQEEAMLRGQASPVVQSNLRQQAKKGGVLDSEQAKNYAAANLMWQQGVNMAPRRFG